MKNAKSFFLNGEKFFTPETISLLDVITYFNYSSSLLVIEYNNFICSRENWTTIYVNDQDRVEIVTIVGGG